jgi:uncharacterized protein (UPF0335 family)
MTLAKNSMEGKAQAFLKRIESLNADAESAKGTYMQECRERREDIKSVYEEAKDAGVPPKALRGLVKKRALEKKAAAIPDGFDIDDAAAYATLCEALGDLGKAAAKAAGHAPNGTDDDDRDLRGTAQKQADKERADEAALEGVGRG